MTNDSKIFTVPSKTSASKTFKPSAQISAKKRQQLYREVLYCIRHKIRLTAQEYSASDVEIYQLMREAFHINAEDHQKVMKLVAKENPPKRLLHVLLVEAENIVAKDPDGFSDPYCMLGIISLEMVEHIYQKIALEPRRPAEPSDPKQQVKLTKKNVIGFKPSLKEGMATKLVQSSSVKEDTLKPQWNERFQFELDDVETDYLHVELWDHDINCSVAAELKKINLVHGASGLKRYFKEVGESLVAQKTGGSTDDFLGQINVPLYDIPSIGKDEWYELDPKSLSSNVSGRARLKLQLGAKRHYKGTDNWGVATDHLALMCILTDYEIELADGIRSWSGKHSLAVETILHQHAIHCNISEFQRAMFRWLALHRYHTESVSFPFYILRELRAAWKQSSLADHEQEAVNITFNNNLAESAGAKASKTVSFQGVSSSRSGSPSRESSPSEMDLDLYFKATASSRKLSRESSIAQAEEPRQRGWFPCFQAEGERKRKRKRKRPLVPPAAPPLADVECKITPDLNLTARKFLSDSFRYYLDMLPGLLHRIRTIYPYTEKAKVAQLLGVVLCMTLIHELEVLKKYYQYFVEDLADLLTEAVSIGTRVWYRCEYNAKFNIEKKLTDAQLVREMHEFVHLLLLDFKLSKENYQTVFKGVAAVDFVTTSYTEVNKLLEKDYSTPLTMLCEGLKNSNGDEVSSELHGLFITLAEFADIGNRLPLSEEDYPIKGFKYWFVPVLDVWFRDANTKCIWRITQSIKQDKIEPVNPRVKYSTSAVDVTCAFYQIIEIWLFLEWPDPVASYDYAEKTLDIVCNGAVFYAEEIQRKIVASGFYDEEGVFDIALELCLTINDMEEIRKSLESLPKAFKLNDLIERIESQDGLEAGQHKKANFHAMINSCNDSLEVKIDRLFNMVSKKMAPDVKAKFQKLADAPPKWSPLHALEEVLQYLDSNMLLLNTNLLPGNFQRITDKFWNLVLDEMHNIVKSNSFKKLNFFQRAYNGLEILQEFFYQEGEGLCLEKVQCDKYKELYRILGLWQSETKQLIDHFYMQRSEKLSITEAGTKFGNLYAKIYYNLECQQLYVEVVKAVNLAPLDTNGKCDPFVTVELLPSYLFKQGSTQKTQVIEDDLHPVYEKTFKFNATLESCRAPCSVVRFTVMDHDYLCCNDFAGEAFYRISEAAGVKRNGNGDGNGGQLQQQDSGEIEGLINLPLYHRNPADIEAFCVLQAREWDREASAFVKKIKKRERSIKT